MNSTDTDYEEGYKTPPGSTLIITIFGIVLVVIIAALVWIFLTLPRPVFWGVLLLVIALVFWLLKQVRDHTG